MSVIEEIRAEMSRGAPLTSLEAKQLIVKLAPEMARINTRWSEIAVAGPRSSNHGPVYKRALASGSDEELAALQQEFDRLTVDRDRVRSIHDSLHQTRHAMAVKEASEALPGLQEKLEASIEQAEDTQKALERSFDALQEAYVAVVQARGLAHQGGMPKAGAKPDVVRRLIALSPLSQQNRSALAWRPDVHVDNLGVSRDEASDAARLEWQA
ncbi:hypothetical protein N5J29_00490 [Stenotrophomonas sp. GD03680]|uniref:hypothetical protein n=1 Tax=Stenotrophomonas sp. GD03680 TaxID=2975365 RepID=UPI002448692B|nr:hypothetical protein [Stenotrophomonas sp. GD03680]MDH2021228.1 hypothetical protein [Stenotrophomonas sp. GD03680]